MRLESGNIFSTKEDTPLIRYVKSCHAPEKRRLAAAAGSEQKEQLTRLDRQVEPMERHGGTEPFGKFLDANRYHIGTVVATEATFGPRLSQKK